jgi:predicted glycoside hydrolase/deacetylase ChbG (UPF0249 family)
MDERRYLVVNADDFGQSRGIDDGVVEAFDRGIVTSASLLVDGETAAVAARARPGLSLGLHLDLGEFAFRDGRWQVDRDVVDLGNAVAVAAEAERQLSRFRALAGAGPTHVDSHQHVHRGEPAHAVVARLAGRLGVPLRHDSHVRYCGAFYGQSAEGAPLPERITADALRALVRALEPGVTELCCHPARTVDFAAVYAEERCRELEALCDPAVRAELDRADVRLCSFRDVPLRS